MRKDRGIRVRDKLFARGGIIALLDTDPEAWQEYLDTRRIDERVAQRRINTLRLSKCAHISGRKADH